MAEPARPTPVLDDEPPIDPHAVSRAYAAERARRRARIERRRNARRARVRFWLTLLALLALTGYLVVTVRQEIQRLFGL